MPNTGVFTNATGRDVGISSDLIFAVNGGRLLRSISSGRKAMINLDEEDKAVAYSAWIEEKLEREEILENKIKLLEAEIAVLKEENAFLRGYRDAMRGN